MKLFTASDMDNSRIITHHSELVESPLDWQKAGLTYTASGYGAKIPSRWKINFCGKLYRIYSTCYSNAASCWFTVKGQTIYVA